MISTYPIIALVEVHSPALVVAVDGRGRWVGGRRRPCPWNPVVLTTTGAASGWGRNELRYAGDGQFLQPESKQKAEIYSDDLAVLLAYLNTIAISPIYVGCHFRNFALFRFIIRNWGLLCAIWNSWASIEEAKLSMAIT